MSDSDDTDVLLLIPPDLYFIPSSDSEDHFDSCNWQQRKSGVVSELIDHMQSLESRISAIESRDSPNNSLNLSRGLSLDSIMSCRQTIPRTKFSVSRHSSLQTTPTKPSQRYSLPSTPNTHQKLHYIHEKHHHPNSKETYQSCKRDCSSLKKHDHSKSFSETLQWQHASPDKSALNADVGSPGKESSPLLPPSLNVCENNISYLTYKPLLTGHYSSDHKSIKDMNFPEVNKLLREVQSNDKVSENNSPNGYSIHNNTGPTGKDFCHMRSNGEYTDNRRDQEPKFKPINLHQTANSLNGGKPGNHLDYSQLDSSFSSFDTDRFKTEFKMWNPSFSQDLEGSKITKIDWNFEDSEDLIDRKKKVTSEQKVCNIDRNAFPKVVNDNHEEDDKKDKNDQYINTNFHPAHNDVPSKSQMLSIAGSCPSISQAASDFRLLGSLAKRSKLTNSIIGESNCPQTSATSGINGNESSNERSQRLLTLSDIWNQDSSKSEEERLRLKLEEEKFRREHCEQLIQELQKKLLEHQEKIAVAIGVDNEKNSFISHFQVSWKAMKHELSQLAMERDNLQKILKGISEKHQVEIVTYQKQIAEYKEELSKAINLATGYKEKSDALDEEKADMLKNHADELQNYQTIAQQLEKRYEETKSDCQRLLEKNEELDQRLKDVQQDLNAELMKSSEVKAELSVIHKALDACEAELVILRQEKENLQCTLKEERIKNNVLEKDNNSLVMAVDEANKAEKLAKTEVRSLAEHQEKLRAELRDVYQKQVDEVVKTKLHEFQSQLDSAEAVFQSEVETKQRAIAECAARKIKSVIDKHQLEIHLLEEKHKEEKKLFELKIAQAVQKSSILEAQLNSYRKSKSLLVEQLYSMLQKQWQQALVIISGSNGECMSSFQKISVEKLFDFPNGENELIPEHCSTLYTDPAKTDEQKHKNVKSFQQKGFQNESLIALTSNDDSPLSSRKESTNDLKKYIKMVLDMQQQKDDDQKSNIVNDDVPSSRQEMPCKQSLSKNRGVTQEEGNSKWEPISEVSIHDTSEYLSPPQKFPFKNDHTKEK